jgi:hypothetical protein
MREAHGHVAVPSPLLEAGGPRPFQHLVLTPGRGPPYSFAMQRCRSSDASCMAPWPWEGRSTSRRAAVSGQPPRATGRYGCCRLSNTSRTRRVPRGLCHLGACFAQPTPRRTPSRRGGPRRGRRITVRLVDALLQAWRSHRTCRAGARSSPRYPHWDPR